MSFCNVLYQKTLINLIAQYFQNSHLCMEKISTNLDLIRSLYNETSASENQSLKQELARNSELNAEYVQLREAKNALPKVLFNPSESVLDRILAFSRTTAVAQQV